MDIAEVDDDAVGHGEVYGADHFGSTQASPDWSALEIISPLEREELLLNRLLLPLDATRC